MLFSCSCPGHKTVLNRCEEPKVLEDVLRNIVVEMGSLGAFAPPSLKLKELKEAAYLGTYSECCAIGRAILNARKEHMDPIDALKNMRKDMIILIRGQVTNVVSKTEAGFTRGHFVVESFSDAKPICEEEKDEKLEKEVYEEVFIDFFNEFIVAFGPDHVKPLATSPNLISVVDLYTAEAVTSPDLRSGLRVCVIVLKANPKLLTEKALAVVGPRSFGYDFDFIPMP